MLNFTKSLLFLLCLFSACHRSGEVSSNGADESWVSAWGTATVSAPLTNQISDLTMRQIVRTSLPGGRFRLLLRNRSDCPPVEIGAASIALRAQGSKIVESTSRPLTFDGKSSAILKPGSTLLTDPVELKVSALDELAVDLYLPGHLELASTVTTHDSGLQTGYFSPGNQAGATAPTVDVLVKDWFWLERLEVLAPAGVQGVAAFGDSITAGWASTPDSNGRWPDHLARRLAGSPNHHASVVNPSISGNRLLEDGYGDSGLSRFERDVLEQAGVTHIIVMIGTNDIGIALDNPTPTAQELIEGHKQLIKQAHAQGVKIYGATLAPFEGAGNWTEVGEEKRQQLNSWIRTSDAYDAILDIDQVLQDPEHPTRLLPIYDSGDHLHPGDEGYKAIGEAIDLELVQGSKL